MRIAVVEADALLRDEALVPDLRNCGFEVDGFGSVAEMHRRDMARVHDVLVLGIGQPGEDGFEIVGRVREADPHIGIVMLAEDASRAHRLHALRLGVDIFLARPPDMDLLVASLQGLARRMEIAGDAFAGPASGPAVPAEAVAGWRLAADGWTMVTPTGQLMGLTVPERAVLVVLDVSRGRPVERRRLIAALTADAAGFDPHRLDALMHRIRRKAGSISPDAVSLPLLSVRNTGYVLGV